MDELRRLAKEIYFLEVHHLEVGAPHLTEQHGKYIRQETAQKLAKALLQAQLQISDADRMAAIVDQMIYAGHLDSRSQLSDARLDYGKPFNPERAKAITSAVPEALRSGETPRTDACFNAAQELIRKYGAREGVGPEFEKGNPYLLASHLERELVATCAMVDDLVQQRDELLESAVSPLARIHEEKP